MLVLELASPFLPSRNLTFLSIFELLPVAMRGFGFVAPWSGSFSAWRQGMRQPLKLGSVPVAVLLRVALQFALGRSIAELSPSLPFTLSIGVLFAVLLFYSLYRCSIR